jgi:hypothetical protein
MAFLTPTIKSLNPANTVVLNFPGGGLQGISGPLILKVDVQSPPGVPLPLNGESVLTIINSDQYRFENNERDLSLAFVQQRSLQKIEVRFRIKNIHALSSTPAPLILTICCFDTKDGANFKMCNSASFPVSRPVSPLTFKAFKPKNK